MFQAQQKNIYKNDIKTTNILDKANKKEKILL